MFTIIFENGGEIEKKSSRTIFYLAKNLKYIILTIYLESYKRHSIPHRIIVIRSHTRGTIFPTKKYEWSHYLDVPITD